MSVMSRCTVYNRFVRYVQVCLYIKKCFWIAFFKWFESIFNIKQNYSYNACHKLQCFIEIHSFKKKSTNIIALKMHKIVIGQSVFICCLLTCSSMAANIFIVSATFTGVKTFEWPWFYHRREHFLLITVGEVGQTYQQNGRKFRAEIYLRATIFCKHFDMVSSWWDIKMFTWSSISLLPFTRSWAAANIEYSQFCV